MPGDFWEAAWDVVCAHCGFQWLVSFRADITTQLRCPSCKRWNEAPGMPEEPSKWNLLP